MTKTKPRRQAPEHLLQKAAQLRARADEAEARAKMTLRKVRTRRAILAGTWMLKRYGEDLSLLTPEILADFKGYLVRENDRAIFEFPGEKDG